MLGLFTADETIYHKIQVTEKSGRGQIIGRLNEKLIGQTSWNFPSPIGSVTSLVDLIPRVAEVGHASMLKDQLPENEAGPVTTSDGKICKHYVFQTVRATVENGDLLGSV